MPSTANDVTNRSREILIRYKMGLCELKDYSIEELIEAAQVAKDYGMGVFVRQCKFYLEQIPVDENNIFSVLNAATYLKMDAVMAKGIQSIQTHKVSSFWKAPELLKVRQGVMSTILKHRKPSPESEVDVLKSVISWLQHHKKRERTLLSEINITFLTSDEFLDVVSAFPSFFTYREISCVIANLLRPGVMKLPPWCKAQMVGDATELDSSVQLVVKESLHVTTTCNVPLLKSSLFGEESFGGSFTFEVKLLKNFCKTANLIKLELAFGSSFVPEDRLKVELFSGDADTGSCKEHVKFNLQSTGDHYSLTIISPLSLKTNMPFIFVLRLKASGLKDWDIDAPVSDGQYRVARIPESTICNSCISMQRHKALCFTPLSDCLVLLDPKCSTKKLVLASFHFESH